jgi:hemolysin activation/secretion protein
VPGTADRLVGLSPGPRVSGSVEADNAGSRYSGVYRAGASLQVNHLLGFDDAASVRGLTSNGGLRYGRLGYELQAGRVRLGAAYSMLDYRLGREFDILDANGRASVASLYGSYPLIRSRQTSLHAQLMFERKGLHDRIDAIASVSDRTVHALTVSLYGNRRDDLAGGISTGSLALSAGSVDIQTAQQRQVDALTALTNGAFRKLNLNATRQQQVTPQFSLHGALTMQAASKNLITAEKMALGGVYAVRAYPEGEAYADQAVLLTVEGRYRLPTQDFLPAQVHLIAFADSASGKLNKSPWSDGVRRRTLSGAGLGLTAHENGNYMVRLYYAHRLGTERDTPAPDRDGRFWLQAVKFF